MSQKDIRIVATRLRPQHTSKTVEQVKTACNVNSNPAARQVRQLPVAPGAGDGILPGAIWREKSDMNSEIIILDKTSTGILWITDVSELAKDIPSEVWVITQKGLQDKYCLK